MSKENLENMVEKDDEKFDSELIYWIPFYGLIKDFEHHFETGWYCHQRTATARHLYQAALFIATVYYAGNKLNSLLDNLIR